MSPQDRMTSRERVVAATELKEPDRVPLFVSTRMFGISHLGYTLSDIFQDPHKYVESQVRMVTDFACDAVWDLAGMNPIGRALGQKMLESKEDVPSPLEPILRDPGDLKKLPSKVLLAGKGPADFFITITRNLKKRLGDDVAVIGYVDSPFLQATVLRGAQNAYMDIYERPGFLHELLDYLIQPILDYSDLQAEAGADIIYTACPVASRVMISRKHYEEFVHPGIKLVIQHWKNKLGRKVLFHTCGDWTDRFDLVVDEGPDIIHVDKVDLAWLKREYGKRVCINGNVGTTTTLMIGTAEEVKKEALGCIQKAGPKGGYMLGADCMVPRNTPKENMKALSEAIQEEGYYPIRF